MKVVLIAGNAGSGKTYLGQKIVECVKSSGLRALQTEYSKYLKLYAEEILGYDKDKDEKPRSFLQNTGSYIREDLRDEDFFVRRMLEDCRIYENYFDVVVISDVRLLWEIEEMLKSKYEVTTILVENENKQMGLTEEEKNHITEREFQKFLKYTYKVDNKGNEDLVYKAKKIWEEIK